MADIKYPNVKVKLVGEDGNAMSIVSRCSRAAKIAKVPQEEVQAFIKEALSGDYNNVLITATKWFDVE